MPFDKHNLTATREWSALALRLQMEERDYVEELVQLAANGNVQQLMHVAGKIEAIRHMLNLPDELFPTPDDVEMPDATRQ